MSKATDALDEIIRDGEGRAGLEGELKRFTRDELIYIIARMCYKDSYKDHILQRAIIDLDFKREMEKIDEEEHLANIADEKARAYNAILEPYKGKKLGEIPMEVINRAHAALQEYRLANDRYMKAAGIKP